MSTVDVEVVAFDLMDTLVRDPFREALTAATGRGLHELFALRDLNAYPAFERGEIDELAYWATYEDAGIAVDPGVFHRVRLEETCWLDGMRELLADLRGAGVTVVVASNYPTWIDHLADTLLDGHVDDVHASCHFGVRKPESAFYERLMAATSCRGEAVVFVDDREVNVDAARAAGLRATLAADAAILRGRLAAWGCPV